MVHQIGVQRVVPGHENGQGTLPRAAGPACLLPEGRPCARVAGDDDRAEAGDVDAQFQGGGGRQTEQFAGVQRPLQGPALLGEVTPAIGGDPLRQRPVDLREALLGDHRDQFRAAPGAYEGDRADALEGQVGEQVGGLGRRGTAYGCALLAVQVGQRGLPEGEDQLAARGGVVGHLPDRQARQTPGCDRGVRRSGGGQEEDRIGPVAGAQAA